MNEILEIPTPPEPIEPSSTPLSEAQALQKGHRIEDHDLNEWDDYSILDRPFIKDESMDNAPKFEFVEDFDESTLVSAYDEGSVKFKNPGWDNDFYIYTNKERLLDSVKSIDRGAAPEANSEYFDNGVKHRTDAQARTIVTEGWIKPDSESGERNISAQREAGGGDRKETDQGGHIFNHAAGGPGEAVNLTAMEGDLNTYMKGQKGAAFRELLGEEKNIINEGADSSHYKVENYRDLERYMQSEADGGKDVYFHNRTHYEGDSRRPDYYDVDVMTKDKDGNTESHTFRFHNIDKAEREDIRNEAYLSNIADLQAEESMKQEKTLEARKGVSVFGEVED